MTTVSNASALRQSHEIETRLSNMTYSLNFVKKEFEVRDCSFHSLNIPCTFNDQS